MKLRTTALLLLLALWGCSSPTTTPSAPGVGHTDKNVGTARPTPALLASLGELPADPREPLLAEGMQFLLGKEHLRKLPLDDALSRQAFDEYLERLDGGKLFLLDGHVAALKAYSERIDDEIREGDLELARKGGALLLARQKVVGGQIASLLQQPFDFSKQEDVETDPDKLSYCISESDLRDRWRRVLKRQTLDRIGQMEQSRKDLAEAKGDAEAVERAKKALAEIPASFEGQEKKAREDLSASYEGRFKRMADIDPIEAAERYLNAVAAVYDPHTVYLAPAAKENFDIEMSGSLEGIGAVLGEDDHYIAVRELVPGGASWQQGELEAGDLILAVAQNGARAVDVADMPIEKVVQMIRGPKGTIVTLTVQKPDKRVATISITRDVVVIEAAYARGAIIDRGAGHGKLGYIYLPSFYGNTRQKRGKTGERNASDDVEKLLRELEKRRVDGVVLDLRGNGGGLLTHARDITGALIDKGPVVQTRSSRGEQEVLSDEEPGVAYRGKLVVMVDRFSASASEILAGALQDYRRAVVVGTGHTHGKGTVQVLVDLDRLRQTPGEPLGVLKLTIQQYFRINGASTQWRGVVPDVLLPDPAAHIESGERFLDHSIPWSETQPLRFATWPKATWDDKKLAEQSAKRIAGVEVFAKVRARCKLLEARRDRTKVPLQIDEWRARHDSDEKALEAVDPKIEDGKPRFQVEVVNYDGSKPLPPRKSGADDGGKPKKDRLAAWVDELARDPWVEESLHVLDDMGAR